MPVINEWKNLLPLIYNRPMLDWRIARVAVVAIGIPASLGGCVGMFNPDINSNGLYKEAQKAADNGGFLSPVLSPYNDKGQVCHKEEVGDCKIIGYDRPGLLGDEHIYMAGVAAVNTMPNALGIGIDQFDKFLAAAAVFYGPGAGLAAGASGSIINEYVKTQNNNTNNVAADHGSDVAIDAKGVKQSGLNAPGAAAGGGISSLTAGPGS